MGDLCSSFDITAIGVRVIGENGNWLTSERASELSKMKRKLCEEAQARALNEFSLFLGFYFPLS